jgi:hypothetical protein
MLESCLTDCSVDITNAVFVSHSITCMYFFRAFAKFRKIVLLASSCAPDRPHGTTRLPLDESLWNLIFTDFSKTRRENSTFVDVRQEWVLYMKTCVHRYSDWLRAGRPGDRVPVWADFSLPSRRALGPIQPPIQWVPGLTRCKAAGAWRWPPTPSIVEVQERLELYLYSPSGLSWPGIGWPLPLP